MLATPSVRRKWPRESYPFAAPAPRKMKSSSRSIPPVFRRLVNSSERLPENGFAAKPNALSRVPEVREHGCRFFGEAAETFHRRTELFEEWGEQLQVARERPSMSGRCLR